MVAESLVQVNRMKLMNRRQTARVYFRACPRIPPSCCDGARECAAFEMLTVRNISISSAASLPSASVTAIHASRESPGADDKLEHVSTAFSHRAHGGARGENGRIAPGKVRSRSSP